MTASSDLMNVVQGLHFQEDRGDLIRQIEPAKWPQLLRLTDAAQLTLPLAIRRQDCLPEPVRERVQQNLMRNAERYARICQAYADVSATLVGRGIEFLVLKGMTHGLLYCDAPAHRPQFDLDLYCPTHSICAAAGAIASLGYEPIRPNRGPTPDHLPAMIRKTGWCWRGDYYDPDMPLTIELHYRFWNARREFFSVDGAGRFPERRTNRIIGGCHMPALHPQDDLAYTTWHLARHLLRGDLRLYHVYELAHFLDRTASDESFWAEWANSAVQARKTEPIAFRLALDWFGCKASSVVLGEIDRLPRTVDRWFRLFAFSPVLALERPNKDELFLHLALAEGTDNRLRIAVQRIVPMNPPRVVMDAHVAESSLALRLRRGTFRAAFLLRRAVHHVRALGPLFRSGLRLWQASWRSV